MKIRSVNVEDAAGIQAAGPGWDESMAGLLGEIQPISQLAGGRCQLSGGMWWMLGLLHETASSEAANIEACRF